MPPGQCGKDSLFVLRQVRFGNLTAAKQCDMY
jgi:hypothetical protein